MIKRLLTIIVLLLTLPYCSAHCQEEPSLTLMVYLCGSNLETEAGAASADLAEMMAHYPADGSIRVIVMPSGSRTWQSEVATSETGIYELTGEGLEQLCTLPLQSMGEPAALTALLDYGYTHAPARQYALVMWNHGAGPNMGLCFDERYAPDGQMDGLTLSELSQALAQSPAAETKLSWIGFDACLMACLETACTVAPYADYMIASQETEPASGWSYAFLGQMSGDASGAETGRRIIDAYFDSLAGSLSSLTMSCVDLSSMPVVSQAMDQLFGELHLHLDEASYPAFADCRVNSKSLGNSTSYEYDLVDLVDLLEVYQDGGMAECSELLAMLDQAIVTSRSNTPYVNGLSVYYPHYGAEETPGPAVSAEYSAFIADMSALRLGKPLTDWSRTSSPAAALADGVTHVTMALTPEQAAMLDAATLLIFKQMSVDDYQLVYRTNDVALTADNVLEAAYEDQALFIINAQGEAVSEALPYSLQGDAVVLTGQLTRDPDNAPEGESSVLFVNCYFRRDPEGRYRLAEVREITDEPTLQGKTTLRLEDFDTLSIYQGSMIPGYAEDGTLLPPAQWARGDMIYGWWFDMADYPGWSIDFITQQDSRSRFALLQMTDTQNQVICSELLPVPNPHIIEIPSEPQTLVDNSYCTIRFTGAQEVRGMHPMLRMNFTCENHDSQPISLSLDLLQLGDVIVRSDMSASAVGPGEMESFEIEIDHESLEQTGVQSTDAVRMTLTVSRNYTEPLFEQAVEFSLSADLSKIAPEPVQWTPLATAQWDGLEFELLEAGSSVERAVTGQLRIRNVTDETVVLDTAYFYLNDLRCLGYLTDRLVAASLPPRAVYYTGLKVNLEGYPNDQYRPQSSRFLTEALGMAQLHTLGLDIHHDDWRHQTRITFTLPHPLTLPGDRSLQRISNWPVIYDKDGLTIRLADYTWQPDSPFQSAYRYINLYMDNQTGHDVQLAIPMNPSDGTFHALYNGSPLTYTRAPSSPAETKVMDSIWFTLAESAETMNSMDILLQITDDNSRADQVQLRLEALSEACTEGDYRILEADQLRVSVVPIP